MQRGRAIVGLALIGLAMLIFTGWSPWSWATHWPGSADEQREQLDSGVRTVALDTGSGDVTIRTRDQARTSLTTRVDAWAWTRCRPLPGRQQRWRGAGRHRGDRRSERAVRPRAHHLQR